MAIESNTSTSFSHSSDVQLTLVVEDRHWRLSKIGHDRFVPYERIGTLAPCQGQIVMAIDGQETRWDVELVDGIVPFDDENTPIRMRIISEIEPAPDHR